jgi:ankyrin repeat protein
MSARGTRSGVFVIALAAVLGLGAVAGARAQVPPLAAEVLAYEGLHHAAWQGDLPRLKGLIASGANLDARDPRGRTALQVATYARQREAIKLLGKAGANLDLLEDDRYDAVTIASVADDAATLSLLLSLGAHAGQTTSRYDGTALIAAAHLGHDEVVRRLIAAGAPLDHVNNQHWTAVIEAVVLGDGGPRHQRALAALVDAGASLKLADRQGNTPLQLAKARGYTAMVKLLESHRAR